MPCLVLVETFDLGDWNDELVSVSPGIRSDTRYPSQVIALHKSQLVSVLFCNQYGESISEVMVDLRLASSGSLNPNRSACTIRVAIERRTAGTQAGHSAPQLG